MAGVSATLEAALLALALGCLAAGCQTTAERAAAVPAAPSEASTRDDTPATGTAKPPVAISGFAHSFIERGKIHMNFCQQTSCGPGSKVSYTFYDAVGDPDFEEFHRTQRKVFSRLKASMPDDTTMTLGEPTRIGDAAYTMFTSTRQTQPQSGSGTVTMSNLIFAQNVTISLISSAEGEALARQNAARFLAGLLAATAAKPGS